MSYPEHRLKEALQVIQEDNERRNANEARKIAETQYRDGFNLRRSTTIRNKLVGAGQLDDISDDEYDPSGRQQKNKRKSGIEINRQKKQKRKISDSSAPDAVVADGTHAFITLKLQTEKGKRFLLQIADKYPQRNEHMQPDNVVSQWRESSGGLHRADRSMLEQSQDFEVAQYLRTAAEESEVESKQHRTLRNGKVREHVPEKRKKDNDETELELSSVSKRQRMNELPLVPTTPTRQEQLQDDSIDDVISIASTRSIKTTSRSPPTPQTPYLASASPPAKNESDIVTLRTSFAHPINFKSLDTSSCSFHTDYRHPILGHGAVTGQYLIFANKPSQLIELEGGHRLRNQNLPPDMMCIACALSYLQITRCPQHTFINLPPNPSLSDGGYLYAHDMLTSLNRTNPNRNTKQIASTCNLCPSPATHKCHSPQLTDKIHRPCRLPNESTDAARSRITRHSPPDGPAVSSSTSSSLPPTPRTLDHSQIQPPLHGCGLLLCGDCHTLICDRCDGHMQENRAGVLREVRMRQLGARADIEFLFREGLIWKAYHVDKKEK